MSAFDPPAPGDPLVRFNAGRCIREGNLIKPDLRKGKIYLDQANDHLLHFYWKERDQSIPEQDMIVLPEEAEFIRVTQCTTGRVYLLRFKKSKEQHFYWLQYKNEEKDEDIVGRVQELLRDFDAHLDSMSELDESTSQEELMRLLDNVEHQDPNATPENILQFLNNIDSQNNAPVTEPTPEVTQPEPTTTTTPVAAQPSTEQFEQFRQILANVNNAGSSSSAPLSLNDVLNTQSITPLLNDPKICESLFPYLPDESEKTAEEVRQVVKSPQFSQALYSLSVALQTGQLGPLLTQLGLDYSAGFSVESFLKAINEQAKKKKKTDAMDTD